MGKPRGRNGRERMSQRFRSSAHLVFHRLSSACSKPHACIYSYDALPLGLMSKRARRQILGVRLEQHRPELAIIRRRDRSEKLCVLVFHIGAVFTVIPTPVFFANSQTSQCPVASERLASRMNWRILPASLNPSDPFVPEFTSTPKGCTDSIADRTFLEVKPPARMIGMSGNRSTIFRLIDQSCTFPVPPT